MKNWVRGDYFPGPPSWAVSLPHNPKNYRPRRKKLIVRYTRPPDFFTMKNFFQKNAIFCEKSIDKRFLLWYNSVNKTRAGAPKRKGEKMLTYGVLENYKIKRVEQTDENVIKAYNRVDDIINRLDDDSADKLIDAIGNYAFDDASADDKALIKSYKIRLTDATIWYWHDND